MLLLDRIAHFWLSVVKWVAPSSRVTRESPASFSSRTACTLDIRTLVIVATIAMARRFGPVTTTGALSTKHDLDLVMLTVAAEIVTHQLLAEDATACLVAEYLDRLEHLRDLGLLTKGVQAR